MGRDQILHRQRGNGSDRRLDLLVERRELAVDDDDAVGADRNGDVAARALQPVGVLAKLNGLDADLGKIDGLLSVGAG
jgi:hypothetical protein